jgi:hypothetical protein
MKTITHPPFPELICKEEEWESTFQMPAWAGFQSRGGAYGAIDSNAPSDGEVDLLVVASSPEQTTPSQYQVSAYEYLSMNGQDIVDSVLKSLLGYYSDLRADWLTFIKAEDLNDVMPEIQSLEDFRSLIGVSGVIIHPYYQDNLAYVGIDFGCTWDEEHGLGVMLHGSRVVSIGGVEAAFAWMPDEATYPE